MASQPRPQYRIKLNRYRLLYFPFLVPVALLLALFNKLSPIPFKIYTLRVERIGHLAANTEEFLCKVDQGMMPREFRSFIHRDHPSNNFLMKMIKRELPVRQYLLPLFDVCHKLGGLGVRSMEITRTMGYHREHLTRKTSPHLSFTQDELREARTQYSGLGLDPDRPFIPVLGRDSAYLKSISEPTDDDSYRNIDINTFIPAMEYLADRYQVLRVGSVVKDALNTAHSSIFDYSMSGKRTELLDVYLSSHCAFFMTCGSGLDSIALYSFRLPVLAVDLAPITCVRNYEDSTLFIYKKYWHTKEQRYLSLQELLQSGIGEMYTPRELTPLDVVIHDNTPEEIEEAAREMDSRLRGDWREDEEGERLQRKFKEIFDRHFPDSELTAKPATSFLKSNPHLLD